MQKYTPPVDKKDKEAQATPRKTLEFPNSGINLTKTGIHLYVRPNLEIQPANKVPSILEKWETLPDALQHVGLLEVVRVDDGVEIWFDGYYGGTIPSAVALKSVLIDQQICVGEGSLLTRADGKNPIFHYMLPAKTIPALGR